MTSCRIYFAFVPVLQYYHSVCRSFLISIFCLFLLLYIVNRHFIVCLTIYNFAYYLFSSFPPLCYFVPEDKVFSRLLNFVQIYNLINEFHSLSVCFCFCEKNLKTLLHSKSLVLTDWVDLVKYVTDNFSWDLCECGNKHYFCGVF